MSVKPKWEYKIIVLNPRDSDPSTALCNLGTDSWRIVAGTVHQSGSEWRVIVERDL